MIVGTWTRSRCETRASDSPVLPRGRPAPLQPRRALRSSSAAFSPVADGTNAPHLFDVNARGCHEDQPRHSGSPAPAADVSGSRCSGRSSASRWSSSAGHPTTATAAAPQRRARQETDTGPGRQFKRVPDQRFYEQVGQPSVSSARARRELGPHLSGVPTTQLPPRAASKSITSTSLQVSVVHSYQALRRPSTHASRSFQSYSTRGLHINSLTARAPPRPSQSRPLLTLRTQRSHSSASSSTTHALRASINSRVQFRTQFIRVHQLRPIRLRVAGRPRRPNDGRASRGRASFARPSSLSHGSRRGARTRAHYSTTAARVRPHYIEHHSRPCSRAGAGSSHCSAFRSPRQGRRPGAGQELSIDRVSLMHACDQRQPSDSTV